MRVRAADERRSQESDVVRIRPASRLRLTWIAGKWGPHDYRRDGEVVRPRIGDVLLIKRCLHARLFSALHLAACHARSPQAGLRTLTILPALRQAARVRRSSLAARNDAGLRFDDRGFRPGQPDGS